MMDNDELKDIGETSTLSEVVIALFDSGYTFDFNTGTDEETRQLLLGEFAEQFIIDGLYRFEGESDASDVVVVYAISCLDGSTKGIFIDGYGLPSNFDFQDIIGKITASGG